MAVIHLQNAAGAQIIAAPIVTKQICDHDSLAGSGMDKVAVSDIDTHMGNAPAVGVEEHQITRLQIGLGDLITDCVLLFAGSGKLNTVFIKHILNIAAAVKALGSSSTPLIGNTDVFLGGIDNFDVDYNKLAFVGGVLNINNVHSRYGDAFFIVSPENKTTYTIGSEINITIDGIQYEADRIRNAFTHGRWYFDNENNTYC